MQTTCLACNIKGLGMIAIYQHPCGLQEMFESVTEVSLCPNDHICILCYDDLKSAHNFKKKCQQNNFSRIQTITNQVIEAEVPATISESTSQEPKNNVEIEEITTSNQFEDSEVLVIFKESEIADKSEEEEDISTFIEEDEPNHSADEQKAVDEKILAKPKRLNIFNKVHNKMCEYCFKEFDTIDLKTEHTNDHKNEEKPYSCCYDKCKARFKDKVGFRNHFRIHNSENKYICRYCEKKFNQKGNLVSHERVHEGKKPFSCPTCDKAFSESGNLKNHIRTHTDERPYTCKVCEKKFRTHYSHTIHLRQHTNERPYACENCGKTFTSSGKLSIHKRIHTGERPFKCPVCPSRFTESSGLRRHSKIH